MVVVVVLRFSERNEGMPLDAIVVMVHSEGHVVEVLIFDEVEDQACPVNRVVESSGCPLEISPFGCWPGVR